MKIFVIINFLGLLLVSVWIPSAYSTYIQESLDGTWVGEYQVQGKRVYINAGFKKDKEEIRAVLVAPLEDGARQPLTRVNLQSSHVHFELTKNSETLLFDGVLKDNIISGNVKQNEVSGTFQLIRIAKDDPTAFNQYTGDYQFASNELLVIGRTLTQLHYYDPKSRRTGPLLPLSENVFFGGLSNGIHFPVDLKVTFVKDQQGEVTGMNVSQDGASSRFAKKVGLYNNEEVSFKNGDLTLSGTIKTPLQAGSHPAVILLHGSNAQSRYSQNASLEFLADHFARRGIAVLTYDKRGVGASTGDWEKASFDDLAADALSGVELLKKRKDINPKQIGLWGISQGAWLVELAASRSTDIAFIIPVSGGGVNPEIQQVKWTELQMRADGFSEEDIQQAVTLQKLKFHFARTGEGWEKYEDAFQKARNKKWFSVYVGSPASKEDSAFEFWRRINSFEPAPVLMKVTCPILVILGERDTITPVPETIANFEKALNESKNKKYKVKVFPKGNHSLLEAETGGEKERPYLKNYVASYYDVMTDWILELGRATK